MGPSQCAGPEQMCPGTTGPPFVKLIGPRLKNWTNFSRSGSRGRPSHLTWPVLGDLPQLPLSGNSLCGGVGAFEPRPVWEKTAGGWASCSIGGPTSPPKMEKRTTFLRVSTLLALRKSGSEERDQSTLWVPKPVGSASLICGRGVGRSKQSYSGFLLSAPPWCVPSSACGGWRPTAGL